MVDLNKDKLNMGEWHTGSDIRSEWHLVEIGGIAQVVGGSTPSTKDPTNFGGTFHGSRQRTYRALMIAMSQGESAT